MKTPLKTVLFAALAAFGVPAAFAAPENHEEFARQYMPESQAIFERFRKDCAETKKLRDALAEDLRVMNRPSRDDAGYFALCSKIDALEQREAEWTAQIKDAFFKHKAAMATSEQLAAADAVLAKKSLAWENDELEPILKKSIALHRQQLQKAINQRLEAIRIHFGVPVTVKIPGRRYAFGKYEVTQREYEAVMGKNPSCFKGMNLPVERVSWHDAVAFCEKLTVQERALGRISEEQEYRLPTEDEWEYACRAGRNYASMLSELHGEFFEQLMNGWFASNSGSRTHSVGQNAPNAFGLYDVYGNVWEWTSTLWNSGRVNRGGGYANACGSLYRQGWSPSHCGSDLGFRVVLDPAE